MHMVENLSEEAEAGRELNRHVDGEVVLREASPAIMAALRAEDRYWVNVFGNADPECGLTLDELRQWGEVLDEATIANPHLKHGLMLRSSYIWKGGIHHGELSSDGRNRDGNVKALVDHPVNQANYFSSPARKRREKSLYNRGIALYLGDNQTKLLQPLDLRYVVDEYKNPGLGEDIWAYKIKWEEIDPRSNQKRTKEEWIFTDRFPGFPEHMRPKGADSTWKPDRIGLADGVNAPVNKDMTILDQDANGTDGFSHGAPDALAALIWTRIVRDLFMDGVTMTHALATIAFKATSTEKASQNVNMAFATPQTPGSTAKVGGANDIDAMPTAGKGYDFDSFRSVIAVVAAALDVSVIALTADPGTAGSSYGSAQTLDLPTRLAMESRRDEHVEFEKRVLRWLGASDPQAWFEPFDDPTEMLREIQYLVLKWATGLYEALEMKAQMEGVDPSKVKVPDGVLLPNNVKSLPRRDIDRDGQPGTNATTSSPGQGVGTGAGGTDSGGDLRTDQIANSFNLDRAFEIVERVEKLLEEYQRPAA